MNKLYLWSITSALAGFIFGFDTVVISGAEQTIQKLWGLSQPMHGAAMSSALWGTVVGSLIGGWPTEKFGRKKTLFWIGIFYLIAAIGSGLAPEVYTFIASRFIGGLGIGISTIAAPLYISEISPPDKRGRLAGMFQFNIVFGILVAYLSNYLLGGVGEHAWRWMLGVAAFPSLVYMVMCFGIPESPRWLIGHARNLEKGKSVLRIISPSASEEEISATARGIEAQSTSSSKGAPSTPFWSARLRTPILLAFLIAFFNQLSGINAILYFAPRIFEMTGLGAQTAMLTSVGIGVTNLVFTFVGLWLIDKLGRRTLLYIGSFGYIASLGLVAWAFYSKTYGIVPACIFAFIAAHAIGQGAVIWVFISEIFPNEHRATGQTLGSFTHWIFAALLTQFFPDMVARFHPGTVFLFFCFMMCLQLVWVKFMVPETKGVALEDVEGRILH
ncbi:MAG: sugar porter family MFS transporter [Verrucomicrobiaceae bacterium]|nr:MAG: sugar porter family MFS transporter [Verrucomicrobiaceae bacterium]